MTALEPAGPAHAEALAVIHALAFPPGERWGAPAMALQLSLTGAFGWLSVAGGMVLARVVADEAEVLTLGVVPAARGGGLGRMLLRQALVTAAECGARQMFLEVSERNEAARALYATSGFAVVGRRPSYYRDGATALVLRTTIVS